ncbi:DnaB-like helicase C-terminal domain-containing protein [Chlamydiifrater volucris]|uniref:DnaB-like helicase C-terminal domain-containing protein n=1 Tax=Chlamydiifrater volucris TaxID=2681470 RepID=UPI001BCDAF10|nr:DnaB-like helicase C-terminal domain-containing protein [Chlamydiifrater volucris]
MNPSRQEDAGIKEINNHLDIEYFLLGQAVTFSEQAKILVKELEEEHFQKLSHKIVFNAIKTLVLNEKPCNAYFIWEEIRKARQEDKMDSSYILSLYCDTSNCVEIYCYIDFLQEKLANKKLSDALQKVSKDFYQHFDRKPTKVLVEELQDSLSKIQKRFFSKEKTKKESIKDILFSKEREEEPLMKKISFRYEYKQTTQKDFSDGLPTGFLFLDEAASILSEGSYVILAARPSVGKTAFSINLATFLSYQKKIPVGFVSLEMSKNQIAERMLSNLCSIPSESLRRGNFERSSLEKLEKVGENLKSTPMYILGEDCSTINSLMAQAKRLKEEFGISILFIDYIQLIRSKTLFENRQNEVAEVSRQLRGLASDLRLPIVCLSQLSRRVEERGNKRPIISDLRDSGQIEQDADSILFLHKKECYENRDIRKTLIELILAKNRHGPVLSGFLNFDVTTGVFHENSKKW